VPDYRLTLEARPEPLTSVVYETIRRAVIDRRIPPGVRITESGLAAQLGVSKTPVREALLRLRQVGVVEVDGRRLLRVVRPCEASITCAYEAREALEVFTARKAAERAGGDETGAIALAAERSLEAAGERDLDAFRVWDGEFHRAIARVADNPRLARMIEDVTTLILTLRERDLPTDGASLECGRAHVAIARAVAAGDCAGAEEAMRRHLRHVAASVSAGLLPAPA
jgi:DNA-binding GntR family transcriptional regulator